MRLGRDVRVIPVLRHLAVLLAAATGEACNAENGIGTVRGTLNVPVCNVEDDRPKPLDWPNPINAVWKHFVVDAFDSSKYSQYPENQLNIRMQGSSRLPEAADALSFWIVDSYEVVRCMLHRTNSDGTPDWNEQLCEDGASGPVGPNGEGRMLIGTEGEKVTSHFVLRDSCGSRPTISATALGRCDDPASNCPGLTVCPGRGSWIIFSEFGHPSSPVKRQFKVNTDERITAFAYHVELCDSVTIVAQQRLEVPLPVPQITGTLDGDFSFLLDP